MRVTMIDRVAVEETAFIAPEAVVNALDDAPFVMLTEDDDVGAAVNPLHRKDGVAASEDAVGPECRNSL